MGRSARLLFRLAEIPGIARLRYTTSHPRDMDDDLIAAHRDLPKLMPYLHLPVQSGSDRVLEGDEPPAHGAPTICGWSSASARRGPTSRCRAISSSAFPARPRPISRRRCELVATVGYAQAFSFKYSPRPGTPGAEMHDQVPEAVKAERLQRLQALLTQQQRDFAAGHARRARSTCCSRSPAARPASSSAARPGCRRCMVDETAGEIGDIVSGANHREHRARTACSRERGSDDGRARLRRDG